ncbi:MAG TPA: ABC transporter substrate-binding protein [Acidimicrobiales bacterium]
MFSRRSWRALVLSLLCLAAFVVPVSFSNAVQVTNANENARTLSLSLPGTFNGCAYLDTGATASTSAILDLVRPSAFITAANGTLVGENGPIASAELTSLTPETVRYTIAPGQTWSNGAPFTGNDLIGWWQKAKTLASVVSDGYRAIKALSESANGLTVTAVFSKSYADWNLLFRDVEALGTPSSCAVSSLVSKPSLGPYYVVSATKHRVVLKMNTDWPLNTNRFGRVIITDSQTLPATANVVFADYTLAVGHALVQSITTHSNLLSRISSSANIEELTFAPMGYFTRSLGVRQALSWSINRQPLIDALFGAVTLIPQVAASAIYSQGQSQYPGTAGGGLSGQLPPVTIKTPTTNGTSDCTSCAVEELTQHGYHRASSGWFNEAGRRLTIRLGVGPSDLDHRVALAVKSYWTSVGVSSTLVSEPSDTVAARSAASSNVDAAVFARPTRTAPSFAARSWAGAAYSNTFPSGVRIATVTAYFNQASAIFNPVTAASTWLKLDQIILKDYWVRPLFTAPSLAVWTSTLATVLNSFTEAGFVDQLPTWSIAPVVRTN